MRLRRVQAGRDWFSEYRHNEYEVYELADKSLGRMQEMADRLNLAGYEDDRCAERCEDGQWSVCFQIDKSDVASFKADYRQLKLGDGFAAATQLNS